MSSFFALNHHPSAFSALMGYITRLGRQGDQTPEMVREIRVATCSWTWWVQAERQRVGAGPSCVPASLGSHAGSIGCLIRKVHFPKCDWATRVYGWNATSNSAGAPSWWKTVSRLCWVGFCIFVKVLRPCPTNYAVVSSVLMLSLSKWQKLFSPLIQFLIFYFSYYFSSSKKISTFFFFFFTSQPMVSRPLATWG